MTISERLKEIDEFIHGKIGDDEVSWETLVIWVIDLRNAYEAMRNVAISRYYGTTYDVAVKSIDELAEAELTKLDKEAT